MKIIHICMQNMIKEKEDNKGKIKKTTNLIIYLILLS